MFGTLQDSKVCLIWATALSVILNSLEGGRKEKKAWIGNRDWETPKWGAACKREQTHSPAEPCSCQIWSCSFICQSHRKLTQQKKEFLVFQQQQGKPSYPVAKVLLHPTQRKKQKLLIGTAREEVGTTTSVATHVRGGMKQDPETDASLATQKRLYGFVQWQWLDKGKQPDPQGSDWARMRFIIFHLF